MDQKRTVWISIAAGIFLCAVIGLACIICKPFSSKTPVVEQPADTSSLWITTEGSEFAQGTATPNEQVPSTYGENAENAPALTEEGIEVPEISAAPELTVKDGSSKEDSANESEGTTTIDLNMMKNASNVTANNSAAQKAIDETASTKNTKAAESTKSVETKNETASTKSTASSKSDVKKQASTSGTKTASKKTTSASGSSKKSTAAKTASEEKTPVQYWVQVASYTTRKHADDARAQLDANKIPCEVFTKTQNGSLHYRVRVGPYTTKAEAEYWKGRVIAIDFFKNSGAYVTQ